MKQDEVDKLITIAGALGGYPREALEFVLASWSSFEIEYRIHISCEDLCWRLHDNAIQEFGTEAQSQLAKWGIQSTEDFGELVLLLSDHGLILVSDDDSLDDFRDVFEFENQFEAFKYPRRTFRQWSIAGLFVLTTILAIVVSGFTRRGFDGAVAALISSWFSLLGAIFIFMAVTTRFRGWLFLLVVGSLFLAGGLFFFFTLSYW